MHFFSVCFLLKIRADSCDFHWLFYTLSLKGFSSKNVQILNNFVVLHHILNYFFLKNLKKWINFLRKSRGRFANQPPRFAHINNFCWTLQYIHYQVKPLLSLNASPFTQVIEFTAASQTKPIFRIKSNFITFLIHVICQI